MHLITREELKAKLDRGDKFMLIMTMDSTTYKQAHIPGSIDLNHMGSRPSLISTHDEIVVYSADEACQASQQTYDRLVSGGFTNVRRYAGGIVDWQTAGYPIEGKNSQ